MIAVHRGVIVLAATAALAAASTARADDAQIKRGQEVYNAQKCQMCHSIAGTDASGKLAPDLTHFASRRSIAAGTAPNRRGELTRWIVDPQHLKPGNYMPPTALTASEVHSIVTYLESLE